MILQQDATNPSFGNAIIERIIRILNTPIIEQKGQFSVSIMSLILLVIVLIVASLVSRFLRGFLKKRVLPRFPHLDAGLQYTLLRIVHYVIIAIGIIYSVKLGFAVDLTSIAVILGFLSVGIGFGLQYIASDLASGFILLFERPVRVGDRLKLGDIEGRVETISLRSTRLKTNDDVMVIVPNSELVRNKIINWSYCNRVRIRVPVGVAYGSDVQKVTDALIEAGRSVEKVLEDPAPKVYLKEFGDSSINFELLVWIALPHNHAQIRSDINYQIERVFRRERIEIPFPQRDLRLRSGTFRIIRDGAGVDEFETLATDRMEGEKGREPASKPRH
ncbi:MAG TPA: mechanosensitive ion channel domain-containing protein [Blastocatellia bacterium]|nr:mechanosensitive ion channel domain-containing protein [Blastocatellia bacterium]